MAQIEFKDVSRIGTRLAGAGGLARSHLLGAIADSQVALVLLQSVVDQACFTRAIVLVCAAVGDLWVALLGLEHECCLASLARGQLSGVCTVGAALGHVRVAQVVLQSFSVVAGLAHAHLLRSRLILLALHYCFVAHLCLQRVVSIAFRALTVGIVGLAMLCLLHARILLRFHLVGLARVAGTSCCRTLSLALGHCGVAQIVL